jgi:hypothetical protein
MNTNEILFIYYTKIGDVQPMGPTIYMNNFRTHLPDEPEFKTHEMR